MLNLKIFIVMKRLLMLVALLSISTMAMAQEKSKSGGFYWAAATKTSCVLTENIDKQFFTEETEYALGYDFNDKLGLYVPLNFTMAIYPKTRTYQEFCYLGLGGKYQFYQSGPEKLSVVASAQTTLGKNDWGGAMTYELALFEEIGFFNFSLGAKYFDAKSLFVPDRWCLVGSIGIKFGFGK